MTRLVQGAHSDDVPEVGAAHVDADLVDDFLVIKGVGEAVGAGKEHLPVGVDGILTPSSQRVARGVPIQTVWLCVPSTDSATIWPTPYLHWPHGRSDAVTQ